MQLTVTFRHMEPSEQLKEYSREKLARLEKYLDAVVEAEVVMTVEKFRRRVEVLIVSDGLKIKAEEETEDMYSAIDMVADKLEKQVKRRREKMKTHKGGAGKREVWPEDGPDAGEDFPAEEEALPLDRRQVVKPEVLTLAEAGARLAATAAGLVVFVNADDRRLSILRQASGGRRELLSIVD